MRGTKKDNDAQVSKQNISYYDNIAANYDAILDKDAANTAIRKKVADKFTSLVKGGTILDFGGGTGQDLAWQVRHGYHILFCEPAAAMRAIAIERSRKEFPGSTISFFSNGETDFRAWSDAFPFDRKADAVLANFAVINCIPDIGTLFEKFALATRPGGNVIALILDNSLGKRLRSNLRGTITSFFTGTPASIFIEYDGQRQLVYIHSTREIRKALANRFELSSMERLHGFGFCLIHLTRK